MSNIKTLVRGVYDIQKLRIQIGNRIVGNFKAKLGQEAGMPESEMGEDEKKVIDVLRLHYRKITDGVKTFPRQSSFVGDEVISSYTELCLLNILNLNRVKLNIFASLKTCLKSIRCLRGFSKAFAGAALR
jgi:hypothetical protein